MIWFFDNDHLLTVKGITDSNDADIDDATVTVKITDKDDNELLSDTMTSAGGGDYTLALNDDLIPNNYEYYTVTIEAIKGTTKAKWVDSIKSKTRDFS